MNEWEFGETIPFTATITSPAGVLVNPTTVFITIKSPANIVTISNIDMTLESLGVYTYFYTTGSADTLGIYTFKITAIGSDNKVTIYTSEFKVVSEI